MAHMSWNKYFSPTLILINAAQSQWICQFLIMSSWLREPLVWMSRAIRTRINKEPGEQWKVIDSKDNTTVLQPPSLMSELNSHQQVLARPRRPRGLHHNSLLFLATATDQSAALNTNSAVESLWMISTPSIPNDQVKLCISLVPESDAVVCIISIIIVTPAVVMPLKDSECLRIQVLPTPTDSPAVEPSTPDCSAGIDTMDSMHATSGIGWMSPPPHLSLEVRTSSSESTTSLRGCTVNSAKTNNSAMPHRSAHSRTPSSKRKQQTSHDKQVLMHSVSSALSWRRSSSASHSVETLPQSTPQKVVESRKRRHIVRRRPALLHCSHHLSTARPSSSTSIVTLETTRPVPPHKLSRPTLRLPALPSTAIWGRTKLPKPSSLATSADVTASAVLPPPLDEHIIPLSPSHGPATIVKKETTFEQFDNQQTVAASSCEYVLQQLHCAVERWIIQTHEVATKSVLATTNRYTLLLPFGSYRLQAWTPESDLDLVLVGPSWLSRQTVFANLAAYLQSHFASTMTTVVVVPHAFVPIIRFTLCQQAVDLVYCQAPVDVLPIQNLQAEDVLDWIPRLDSKSLLSLNGWRSTEALVRIVHADAHQHESFLFTLRSVKAWARQRGVYSQTFGFLGGAGWAILVAHLMQDLVEQQYTFTPTSLLVTFFQYFSRFPWNERVVRLATFDEKTGSGSNINYYNVVNQHNTIGGVMRILTPIEPVMNASFNVTPSTLKVLQAEWQRAHRVLNSVNLWKTIGEPVPFFQIYSFYLCTSLSSPTTTLLTQWSGWVESQLRRLLLALHRERSVLMAHPLPLWLPSTETKSCTIGVPSTIESTRCYIGLQFHKDYVSPSIFSMLESYRQTVLDTSFLPNTDAHIQLRISIVPGEHPHHGKSFAST